MTYRAVLFDLDGTLYRGETPIAGAPEAVQRLAEAGLRVGYVTNNSTQTREAFAAKLNHLGFPATVSDVIGTGYGAAELVRSQGIQNVAVLGETGLSLSMQEAGLSVVDFEDAPEAVICGLNRQFTYDLLRRAMLAIRAGARFVATNTDATYPMEGGVLIPGSGSLIAAIRTCSETEPIVIGKPGPMMLEMLMKEFGVDPQETLMVGDRIDTDIDAGRNAGCAVHLVLTGIESVAPPDLEASPTVVELVDELLS